MAMTIGEASAVSQLLHVLARDDWALAHTPTVDALAETLALLDERAAKPLQLSYILVTDPDLHEVADELLQRLEDAR